MKVAVSTAKELVFIPKWLGNDELSEDEQIKIHYKAPTILIKDTLSPMKIDMVTSQDKVNENGNPAMEQKVSIVVDRPKLLHTLVTKIKGLSVIRDGIEVPVTTTQQLFTAGVELDDLVSEIFAFLQETLHSKVVEEKN